MVRSIKISEEDIFKFVFNPESLKDEVKVYIQTNVELFSEEISYCIQLKNDFAENQLQHNNKKIESINLKQIIELFPNEIKVNPNQGVVLAAASEKVHHVKKHISFSDSEENFLIRVVDVQSKCMLYFFSKDTNLSKIRIKIFPSENEYYINNIKKPIEIQPEAEIQKITLI